MNNPKVSYFLLPNTDFLVVRWYKKDDGEECLEQAWEIFTHQFHERSQRNTANLVGSGFGFG